MATITREVRYAPCGDCQTIMKRDDMFSVNVKVYDPDDRESKIQIRLCKGCVGELKDDLSPLRWSNSSMETRVETVQVDDQAAAR